MADRYLVTWRDRPDDAADPGAGVADLLDEAALAAAFAETFTAAFAEVPVEQALAEGVIVRPPPPDHGDRSTVADLEARGYRVKLLRDTNLIHVGDYRVDVEAEGPWDEIPDDLRVPPELAATWPHHLVQLAGPPRREWVKHIEEAGGVDVAEAVSRYALFVCAPPERVAALRGLRLPDDRTGDGSFVVWTGPFHPAYRLGRELADPSAETSHLLVSVYPDECAADTAAAIAALGGRVVDEWGVEGAYRDRFAFLVVESAAVAAASIARLPYVRSVEPHAAQLTSDSERSAQIIAGRFDTALPPHTAPVAGYREFLDGCGLDGSGVVLGICDSGVDTNNDATLHPDLKGRLSFFVDVTRGTTPVDKEGHGTHVAGIAVGGGVGATFSPGGFKLGMGVAPAARFGVVNATAVGGPGTEPIYRYTRMMVRNGVHVMNNSWRQGKAAGYSANARLVDMLVRDPTGDERTDPAGDYLVLVFSAGNRGPEEKSITEPKEAKNPIVVGSTHNWNKPNDDIRRMPRNSSRGPARDGRCLPTVVAPGTDVVATRTRFQNGNGRPGKDFEDADHIAHDDYTVDSGTSMAAPHVAGMCALLIQWWRGRNAGRNPSPAMLKALLVNGAEDLAGGPSGRVDDNQQRVPLGPIPNNDQGWGRVCLQNIVADHPASQRGPKILRDQVLPFKKAGQQHKVTVRAHDPARPLRITLAWTDPPGAANASPALVNDLDLEVVETNGAQRHLYKGNHFANGFSVPDQGDSDDLNNVECVYIEKPTGRYEIIVVAQKLASSALPPFTGDVYQDYALVIDNAVEIPPV